jgi:hypothetical protein
MRSKRLIVEVADKRNASRDAAGRGKGLEMYPALTFDGDHEP